MSIYTMLSAQANLDRLIIKEKKIEESLVLNTVVALDVELSEMANEKRWFKHWSNKRNEAKDGLLDEIADVMHFYFSLAIQKRWESTLRGMPVKTDVNYQEANKLYLDIKGLLFQSFKEVNQKEDNSIFFGCSWEKFLSFALYFCGYTFEELEAAYYAKHEINLARQSNGY